MKKYLRNLIQVEQGQDLIEYTLLLAFVVLASAALFISAGGSIKGIWAQSNVILTQANTAATGGATSKKTRPTSAARIPSSSRRLPRCPS